jgi:hypothetical protein
MQQPRLWRELLREVIENMAERQRIAHALGINPITLMRWAEKLSRPRALHRQKLAEAMPAHIRQEFAASLAKEFPEDSQPSSEGEEEPISEIPSAFYGRIFSAYTSTSRSLRASTIYTIILQQMLAHLDADQEGLLISVIRCTRPAPGRPVRSLQEIFGRGTPPFKLIQELQPALLGMESLAGAAVMQFARRVNQNLRQTSFAPALRTEYEESAMVCPLTFEGGTAGCLLVSSTRLNYFIPRRQQLIQDYANLVVLALQPDDFYEREQMALAVMPPFDIQQKEFSVFRDDVKGILQRPGNTGLTEAEAELIALQEIEEALIQQM